MQNADGNSMGAVVYLATPVDKREMLLLDVPQSRSRDGRRCGSIRIAYEKDIRALFAHCSGLRREFSLVHIELCSNAAECTDFDRFGVTRASAASAADDAASAVTGAASHGVTDPCVSRGAAIESEQSSRQSAGDGSGFAGDAVGGAARVDVGAFGGRPNSRRALLVR